MLSRVKIQNFKSIGEPGVDLELKPLTFLVGPNGGGKSSILEAIGVAAQRQERGQSAHVPSWQDIFHKASESQVVEVRIDVLFMPMHDRVGHRFQITKDEQAGISLRPVHLLDGNVTRQSDIVQMVDKFCSRELTPKTFLISSARGNVPYSVDTRPEPSWVGTHGEDLLRLLARIYGRREYDEKAEIIAKWANGFGVQALKAGLWESNRVGSDYLDTELRIPVNLALASSGARQILTVITQLFWAPRGSLIMIEEPEISLHPKAQIDALEMFAEAIKEDKQIIATTHSLFLMQAIGYGVHKGWLDASQVAIHHVEKKKAMGTISKQLPIKKTGYIKGWVPSFTKVERDMLREWVKTLPKA